MPIISRRRFLVLGALGGAGGLAACGSDDDPRAEGRDGELLGATLGAESTLTDAYQAALSGLTTADQGVVNVSRNASAARAQELERLVADAEGDPGDTPEVAVNGVEGAIAAGAIAIVAYREAAGLLSSAELRRTATASLAQVAGEQGALRTLEGSEPAPRPFVTGAEEEPLTAPEDTADEASEDSTSTNETTTSEGG